MKVNVQFDYQQQTSRSIIVQCDLEKKIGYTNAEKKTNELLTDDPKSVREMYNSKGTKARIDVEEETVCEHG